MHLAYSLQTTPLRLQAISLSNSTALGKTTHLTFSPNLNTMYFVTLGQFQLHNLKNSDEDLVNNAQLLRLRLRGKTNSTPRKTLNEVLDKDMLELESCH